MLVATAFWAAFDSSNLELHKYRGGSNGPVFVFLIIVCMWIFFFPHYLVIRSQRIAGELQLKWQYREADAPADDTEVARPSASGPA